MEEIRPRRAASRRSPPRSLRVASVSRALRRSPTTTSSRPSPLAAGTPPRRGRLDWTVVALTYRTAGESHGPALFAVVEGLPAGLPLVPDDIDADLARRQRGYGRGGRMKIETRPRAGEERPARRRARSAARSRSRSPNLDHPNWRPTGWRSGSPHERGRAAHAPAPGSRRPGGRCSSTAPTTCGPSSSAPAPARRRPASRPAAWPRRCCAARHRDPQPRRAHRPGVACRRATTSPLRRLRGRRREPGALPRPGRVQRA